MRSPPPKPPNPPRRVSTPLGINSPIQADLESFADACRRFYYQIPSGSLDYDPATRIDNILRDAPQAHRATYIKLQAAIRTRFHRDAENRRCRAFLNTIDNAKSNQTIIKALGTGPTASGNLAVMRSAAAKKVRKDRLQKFLKEYAVKSLPGPHPFLRYLYVTLRVQSLSEVAGGAGNHLATWEIEDEVWMESGDQKFTKDAIELVKGVLGFQEIQVQENRSSVVSSTPATTPPASAAASDTNHHQQQQQEQQQQQQQQDNSRLRSSSDPFVDPNGNNTVNPPITPTPDVTQPLLNEESSYCSLESFDSSQLVQLVDPNSPVSQMPPLPSTRIRTFSMPDYITNPELNDLCSLFPIFISNPRNNSGLPMVPVIRPNMNNPKALEEGRHHFDDESNYNHHHHHHHHQRDNSSTTSALRSGRVIIGEGLRRDGYKGSFFARLAMWFRHLFRRS